MPHLVSLLDSDAGPVGALGDLCVQDHVDDGVLPVRTVRQETQVAQGLLGRPRLALQFGQLVTWKIGERRQ